MTTVLLSTVVIALTAYVVVLHTRLRQAQHDPLTGLCGRVLWHRQLARCNNRTTVAYFDVDDFKSINDTYGRTAGDLVLVETAHRIRAALPRTAVIARLGGDEFAATWQLDEHSESIEEIVARLQHTLQTRGCRLNRPASLRVCWRRSHRTH